MTVYAKEPESKSGLLPPSIMPVIFLQGSDYEMGYQYGQQAGQYFEVTKDAAWVSALESFSYEKILLELKKYEHYIEKYTPEQIEMMKGMTDGAAALGYPISYTDVLLTNIAPKKLDPAWTYPPGGGLDGEPHLEECCAFSVWGNTTPDGSLICGNSCDSPFIPTVAVVAFPDRGNNYLNASYGPPGVLATAASINSKGVFMGGATGRAGRNIDYNYGIPSPSVYQHLIRFADSAVEAKDMLLSWQYGGASNRHIADTHGNAFVIELSNAFKVAREPGQYTTGVEEYGENTDFIFTTNNYFSAEGGEAILGEKFIPHAGWLGRESSISAVSRNKGLWTMFTRYRGKVDMDFVKMMWRFPGKPPPCTIPVSDECVVTYYETQGEGWDQKICNLNNRVVSIALPDDGDKGVMYICTGPAAKVAYPSAPRDCDFYQIAGTHTFYKLTLASSPAGVVSTAKTDAHDYIAQAYQQLMHLNYRDPGYAALNELYSLANAEYYEGINWSNKAMLASGNDALAYNAKAATAYTRSQAHVQQVYEALVPPPTSPKYLGLKPYMETAWIGQ